MYLKTEVLKITLEASFLTLPKSARRDNTRSVTPTPREVLVRRCYQDLTIRSVALTLPEGCFDTLVSVALTLQEGCCDTLVSVALTLQESCCDTLGNTVHG